MSHAPVDRPSVALLFALRLKPASPLTGLQGEVEHVLSGERCCFRDEAELVAWLQRRHATAEAVPAQAPPDAGPAPRDATM